MAHAPQSKNTSMVAADLMSAHQGGSQTPGDLLDLPTITGTFEIDEDIVTNALPIRGSTVVGAYRYGESLWGKTSKISAKLPSGESINYFFKLVRLGDLGRAMCEGEYIALRDIYAVTPGFCPEPYAWGRYADKDDQPGQEAYFLLAQFRDIGRQPAEPEKLGAGLAALHHESVSPTGKFGYHFRTVHGAPQAVDEWDESWSALFGRHLGHVVEGARPILNWAEFDVVTALVLEIVVPRLLLPLQQEGRVLKPCLLHGDCWDGNTAMDMRTGEAFVFDMCSFYGHNEYDTGNWRAPRHRLSDKRYIQSYVQHFKRSEPVEDWDARNLLYSLCFNIGNAIHVPGSDQRDVVYQDMTTLCQMFCPDQLERRMRKLNATGQDEDVPHLARAPTFCDEEPEEEDAIID